MERTLILLLIALLALIVISLIRRTLSNYKKNRHLDNQLSQKGLDEGHRLKIGKYIGGHPKLQKAVNFTEIISDNSQLYIYGTNWNGGVIKEIAAIQKKQVIDVSSIGTTISITCNEGEFTYNLLFDYNRIDGLKGANKARSKLLQFVWPETFKRMNN